ncbi:hypothetical protein AB0B45_37030 [Nonomuraea sp. NPDC049152]|uniref:hypothetical protein n=1 Tax=Nonomuraea sp. NPDC049152 TaxID=3154350 RepID=UPI0033EB2D8F
MSIIHLRDSDSRIPSNPGLPGVVRDVGQERGRAGVLGYMPRKAPSHGRRISAFAAAAAAVPAIGLAIHPIVTGFIAAAEMAIAIVIGATALFGSDRSSERAFRLLRWIADRPEPAQKTSRDRSGTL